MRKVTYFAVFILVFAVSALGQETPKAEVSLGYSFVRVNPGAPIEGANLHGGSASFAYNLNDWFGLVADLGGYKLSEITVTAFGPVSLDAIGFTYLVGPRLSYRKHERVTPFAHVLFGGARLSSVSVFGQPIPGAENGFAMTVGGGLDFKVYRNVALRLMQAEYLMTRFSDPSSPTGAAATQNNARISAGITFRIGGG